MPLRFEDLDSRPSPYKDFARRKRLPTLNEQFLLYLAMSVTAIGLILMINHKLALIAVLLTVIGLASFYVTAQTNRNRNLVFATEFQNALFASALTRDCRFCLIVGKDGAIVYRNQALAAHFMTLKPGAGLQDWLAQQKVSSADSARILESISKGAEEELAVSIEDRDSQLPMRLSVEPILRPAGFMLLRFRDAKMR